MEWLEGEEVVATTPSIFSRLFWSHTFSVCLFSLIFHQLEIHCYYLLFSLSDGRQTTNMMMMMMSSTVNMQQDYIFTQADFSLKSSRELVKLKKICDYRCR